MTDSFSSILPSIIRLVEKTSGQQFSESKDYYIEAKLRLVAKEWRIPSMQQLVQTLKMSPPPGLIQDINEALCIHESLFFRDQSLFDALKLIVFPNLSKQTRSIKIWCAGCSSGQEPYSYSFLAHENKVPIQIFATDFSRKIIKKAQMGLYSMFEIQRGIPLHKLTTYFFKVDDDWQVRQEYKTPISFQVLNLLSDFDQLDQFDMISCRNVLIYMSAENKLDILRRIDKKLKVDGYLILGSTEALPDALKNQYKQESTGIFRKIS